MTTSILALVRLIFSSWLGEHTVGSGVRVLQ